MRQDINEQIEILEGVEVKIENNEVIVSAEGKENKRAFNVQKILISKKENNIVLESKKAGKKELKILYTIKAHINNMMKGVKEEFVYKLEIAHVHFPMSVEYDQGKRELTIKNFFGEKKPRHATILEDANLKVDKNIITITSHNREIAGQTAANIEKATQIKNKDRRKFQDGIFITEKPGRIYYAK